MVSMNKGVLALAATTLLLAGCSTINPYTGERQTSNAARLGVGGAFVGGVVGAMFNSDDRLKGALIGAGIGGVAGGATGVYMDNQEAKLREEMAGTGVTITRTGDQILLNMPGSITFEVNEADLRDDFENNLDGVAAILVEYPDTLIVISGHTDSTGSLALNQRLSEERAQSVADYLQSQGVQSVRIIPVGAGPNRPIADNSTAEGRAANRRVELVLEPIEQEDLQ
ncbi:MULTISPECIES: OmpA family protein [Saccharospirillaceae]